MISCFIKEPPRALRTHAEDCKNKNPGVQKSRAGHSRRGAHSGLLLLARRPQHLIDPPSAGCEHHQTVEAERDPTGVWHVRKRRQEIFVERITLAVAALLLRHLALQPAALFGRVGELGKAVGEFDAAHKKLEAFGDARVRRRGPRQRRLPGRILIQNGGAANAELGLDALDQHAAENVGPAVVGGDADAGGPRGSGETFAGLLPLGKRRQKIDAGKRAKACATDNRSGSANGSLERPRNENCRVPAACAAARKTAAQSAIKAV